MILARLILAVSSAILVKNHRIAPETDAEHCGYFIREPFIYFGENVVGNIARLGNVQY